MPVGYTSQRNTFYASGLYWAFYFDGSNIIYETSSDGASWSSSTILRPATFMLNFPLSWTGSSWYGHETGAALAYLASGISARAYGNTLDVIVSYEANGFELISCSYPCSGGFSTQLVSFYYQRPLSETGDGASLYVFGIENNQVVYQSYNVASWSSETQLGTFGGAVDANSIQTTYGAAGNNIGVLLVTGSGSPYSLEYGVFSTQNGSWTSAMPPLILLLFFAMLASVLCANLSNRIRTIRCTFCIFPNNEL